MTPPPDDDPEDFAKMLAEFEPPKRRKTFELGEMVRARITAIGRESVFVELGPKAEGVIDLVELRDEEGHVCVKVGDEIDARVVDTGAKSGTVQLRVAGLGGRGIAKKAELETAAAAGLPVDGVVSGVVKGGVEVQVAGVRAFCPISQLDARHVEDAQVFVGQRLKFRITKYDTTFRSVDLVVSRRALLEEEQSRLAAATRKKLTVGAVLHGTVTTLKDYGAFVDLGGLEGLIHVSELGFQRGVKTADVLQVGQPVDVQVLKIETDKDGRERVSLSLKALADDPWANVAERYPVGRRVTAKVTRVEQYGAFLELEPGLEALLHISELAPGAQVKHARERAKVGDAFEVIVQAVEPERRRLSLALSAKVDAETVDAEGATAARAPRSLGTFGDLLAKAQRNDKGKGKR
jgi:small subunit ribosomal protein S1